MVAARTMGAVAVFGAMLFAGLPTASWSQAYPARPVRIIAPFGAGGGGDTTIRLLAQQLGAAMNQQFVVDNRPGGNGVIGVQEALRGGGDGYTLFYGSTTTLAANPSLLKKTGYDPVRDFAPISRVGVLPFMLVSNPGQPFTNMKELIAYARAHPGKLAYASANAAGQVSSALFAQMAGLDILAVSYKTSTNALTDTLAGTVSLMFTDIPPSLGHVRAGKLRAFGVTTAQRTALLPDLPSIAEAGLPGYEMFAWTALCAPAGTPPEIVRRINAELVKILAKPDVKESFARVGVEVESSTPEQLAQFVIAERERWSKLIRMARIEPE
jgi:tripartite-type tricarboxylate transporter receptor subunit TctC